MRLPVRTVGALRIVGVLGVTTALAVTRPTIQNAGVDAAWAGSPVVPSVSAGGLVWPHFGSAGGGRFWGIGYAGVHARVPVAAHGYQFVPLGTGLSGGGPASGTHSTVPGLAAEDVSALTFSVANPGGVGRNPQMQPASMESGATASGAYAAAAQIDTFQNAGLPETVDAAAAAPTESLPFPAASQPFASQRFDGATNNIQLAPDIQLAPNQIAPSPIAPHEIARNQSAPNMQPGSQRNTLPVLQPARQNVPEPAMFTVLVIGLVGLGAARRGTIG